jgi:hypothetical protein
MGASISMGATYRIVELSLHGCHVHNYTIVDWWVKCHVRLFFRHQARGTWELEFQQNRSRHPKIPGPGTHIIGRRPCSLELRKLGQVPSQCRRSGNGRLQTAPSFSRPFFQTSSSNRCVRKLSPMLRSRKPLSTVIAAKSSNISPGDVYSESM